MEKEFRKCLKCGNAECVLYCYSEDFATVPEIRCECGNNGQYYIGADDSKRTYNETFAKINAAWPIVS